MSSCCLSYHGFRSFQENRGKTRNGIFGFFWQLPLVKLAKYWEYLIQLANHIKQQKVLRALKKDIHEKMKHNSGFSNDKLWHFEEVLAEFNALELSDTSFEKVKELWISAHNSEEFNGCLSQEIFLLIKSHKQKLNDDLIVFESKVSEARMFEVLFENGPQFILQLSIILRKSDYVDDIRRGNTEVYSVVVKILTIATSYLSLLIGASGLFKCLSHGTLDKEDQKIPQYSWKSNIIIFPSIIMTVTPRLLTLTIFFGSCKIIPGLITFMVFWLIYTSMFSLLVIPKYKKLKTDTNSEDYRQGLILSYLSAITSPCFFVDPRTKTLLFSSLASICAHVSLLTFLVIFSDSEYLMIPFSNSVSNLQSREFRIACYCLLGLLVTSYIFSLILHLYSKPEFKCYVFHCQSRSSEDDVSLEIIPKFDTSNDTKDKSEQDDENKEESPANSLEENNNSEQNTLDDPPTLRKK